MKQITPINNPDEIKPEAIDNTPQQPASTDSVAATDTPQQQPAPVANDVPTAPSSPVMPDPIDATPSTPVSQPTAGAALDSATPQSSMTQAYTPISPTTPLTSSSPALHNYTYRLPLMSYLLALIYGQMAFVYVYMAYYVVQMYASMNASMRDVPAEYRTSYTPPSVGSMLFSGEMLLYLWLPLIFSLLMVWFLLSGKSVLRWAAVGIAGAMLLYWLYNIFSAFVQSEGAGGWFTLMAFGTGGGLWVIMLLPVAVLATTIWHLVSRRGNEAYSS